MVSLALSALRLVDADGCGDALHDALSGFNPSGLISLINASPFNPGHLRGFEFYRFAVFACPRRGLILSPFITGTGYFFCAQTHLRGVESPVHVCRQIYRLDEFLTFSVSLRYSQPDEHLTLKKRKGIYKTL